MEVNAPILGANATGQEKIKKPINDPRYTIFRPEKFSGQWEIESRMTYHAPRIPAQQVGVQSPNPLKRGI